MKEIDEKDVSAMLEYAVNNDIDPETIKFWWHSHVNMEVKMPINRVTAKPFMGPVPKLNSTTAPRKKTRKNNVKAKPEKTMSGAEVLIKCLVL